MPNMLRGDKLKLRLVVASPSDVQSERNAVKEVVDRFNKLDSVQYGYEIDLFMWETDTYPDFNEKGAQGHIDNLMHLEQTDIFIGIFRNSLGKKLPNTNETGTEHEFKKALSFRKLKLTPKIMLYFGSNTELKSEEETIDFLELQKFKGLIADKSLYFNFVETSAFKNNFEEHLKMVIRDWNNLQQQKVKTQEDNEYFKESFNTISESEKNIDPQFNIDSCFNPLIGDKPNYIEVPTTQGFHEVINNGKITYQKNEGKNSIFIIKDPIRPFEIQIGKSRAIRPGGDPGFIALHDGLEKETIERMYPFISNKENDWLRTVFAELATTPEVIKYINEYDPVDKIKLIASKNPSAPNDIKENNCLFCNSVFIHDRHAYSDNEVCIIPNDFPFGPYFHYMVLPTSPIHSWADLEENHFISMNTTLSKFFNDKSDGIKRLNGSAGIRIGLNSSIRHIVLGKSTKSSAGASIQHVHKQVWGMCHNSNNLGNHLSDICWYYKNQNIDYLGKYMESLKKMGMILFEHGDFIVYIPFGQISIHEVQVMCKIINIANFLELNNDQLISLSKCEYFVSKFFNKIGINSYNELMIAKPFEPKYKEDNFRLIFTFITREIDLAVSELNNLYVVDKFPLDTKMLWENVKDSIFT